MKLLSILVSSCIAAGPVFTAHADQASSDTQIAIVPAPRQIRVEGAAPFIIQPGATRIVAADPSLRAVADYLSEVLAPALGAALPVAGTDPDVSSAIVLKLDPSLPLNDEGYRFVSTPAGVMVTARTPAGAFWGVQTLRQLLAPAALESVKVENVTWTIPSVTIDDEPRFAWRGLMLDVSRHFFNKDEVKQFIDLLALHKFNTFHWHLVDDQGWRIEIKKYPKLTEVGAWRDGIGFNFDPKESTAYGPDGRYGGYFTQDDVREIVAYAKRRYINVVPEIEMPGHSVAALASYPELTCQNNGPFTTEPKRGIHPGVYCASNPQVDRFLADVIAEVIELFPSQYIHIGGDEVPKEPWQNCPRCQAYMKEHNLKDEHELQSDFIRRIDKFLAARGRRLIGWDEILEGGLAEGATVMSWRGTKGGIAAAQAGHDVVMSPTSHCYFDYHQEPDLPKPKRIGRYLPLVHVYSFEPVPAELTPEQAKHVLGGQGNIWTEWMPNFARVEYMTYPRACALAEILWSPKDSRDWNSFTKRLRAHYKRLEAMKVNYFKDAIEQPTTAQAATQPSTRLSP
jgi:hexosaminidase